MRAGKRAVLALGLAYIVSAIGSLLCFTATAHAVEHSEKYSEKYTEKREPCAQQFPHNAPFFGDLHVHTRYSLDASTQGTRTSPAQAYQFAQGAKLDLQPWSKDGRGQRSLRLRQPLDFAMVWDHAELIGEVHICNTPGAEGHKSWQCMLYRNWSRGAYYLFNYKSSMDAEHMGLCGEDAAVCLNAAKIPWREMQEAAETHYDRSSECQFTTFVGYEWTGVESSSGGNLHRNVVFRNGDVPELPISFIDAPRAPLLWRGLQQQCIDAEGSCAALVIPHNSNLSAGFMFAERDRDGASMSAEQAQQRRQFEPIVEVMQHKGASECFYASGVTQDELCAFEQQPTDNIALFDTPPQPDTGFMREVLAKGMMLEQSLGVNPFQFGVIGSTDTHLGAPGAAEEEPYVGHGGAGDPAKDKVPPGLPDKLEYNPGGLAVIWAPENSRDALYAGLQRRETYATSGPRIVSRFFGGWNFPQDLCAAPDRVARGYAEGVPMGGELTVTGGSAKPRFLVAASQDPGVRGAPGIPLQRIQIVKGWLDEKGERREAVFDVAGDGVNGARVDTKTCETSGTGHEQLCAVWTDDNFDPAQRAFYYSRVVENPSCRWSQRICVARKVDCDKPKTIGKGLEGCCAPEHRPVIQERAWSSPIWYSPPGAQ